MDRFVLVKFILNGEHKWEAVPELWANLNDNEFRWPECGDVELHLRQEVENIPATHTYHWLFYEIEEHSGRCFGLADKPDEMKDILNRMSTVVGKHDVTLELRRYKLMIQQLKEENQSMIDELQWCKTVKRPRLRNMIPIKTLRGLANLDDKLKNTYWANLAFDNLMKILTVDKYHIEESIIKILFAVFSHNVDYDNKEKFREKFPRSKLFKKIKQYIYTLDPSFRVDEYINNILVRRILVRDRDLSAL